MKTLPILCVLCVLCAGAFADDIIRDANGKIISTSTRSATSTIVRDPSGEIVESRAARLNTDGSKTIIVRDSAGRVIREEDKARK
jgi:hypothetical protein